MAKRKEMNIGNTDANADWLKTEENRHTEREIHNELARRAKKKREEEE